MAFVLHETANGIKGSQLKSYFHKNRDRLIEPDVVTKLRIHQPN